MSILQSKSDFVRWRKTLHVQPLTNCKLHQRAEVTEGMSAGSSGHYVSDRAGAYYWQAQNSDEYSWADGTSENNLDGATSVGGPDASMYLIQTYGSTRGSQVEIGEDFRCKLVVI